MFGRERILGTVLEYDYYNEIIISEDANHGDYHIEMTNNDDRHRYYERRNHYPEYSYHYHKLKVEFRVDGSIVFGIVEDVWTDKQLVPGMTVPCLYDKKRSCIKKLII